MEETCEESDVCRVQAEINSRDDFKDKYTVYIENTHGHASSLQRDIVYERHIKSLLKNNENPILDDIVKTLQDMIEKLIVD